MRAQCSKCGSMEFHLQIIKPKDKKKPVEGPNNATGGFIALYTVLFNERYKRPPKMFGPVVRTAQYLAKDLKDEAIPLLKTYMSMDNLWFVQNNHSLRCFQMAIEQVREAHIKSVPRDDSKFDMATE